MRIIFVVFFNLFVSNFALAIDFESCPRSLTLTLSDFKTFRRDYITPGSDTYTIYKKAQSDLLRLNSFMFTSKLFSEQNNSCNYFAHASDEIRTFITFKKDNSSRKNIYVNFEIGQIPFSKYILIVSADYDSNTGFNIKSNSANGRHIVNFLASSENTRIAYPIGDAYLRIFY